jgi:uncharacterized protein
MYRKIFYTIMLIGLLLSSLLAACSPKTTPAGDNANMANPASVFCEKNGGKLEIQTDASGNQVGMCIFNDGSSCDEWAYFRGECKPGGVTVAPTSEAAGIGGNANMANPASVFCEQNGGKLEIQTDASGGQIGMCIFNDGSACEEWAYTRGECKPGGAVAAPTKEVTLVEDGWKVYEDTDLGFRFEYPTDARISNGGDNPANNVTITGPLANDEHWPMISVDHPSDRAEFQVPEGTDLAQWLADKALMIPEQRVDDVQIAGTTAVHTRFAGSEQAYPDDKYFFVHGGQLYKIIIGHAGKKEDWDVYNHFLNSFTFTK